MYEESYELQLKKYELEEEKLKLRKQQLLLQRDEIICQVHKYEVDAFAVDEELVENAKCIVWIKEQIEKGKIR